MSILYKAFPAEKKAVFRAIIALKKIIGNLPDKLGIIHKKYCTIGEVRWTLDRGKLLDKCG